MGYISQENLTYALAHMSNGNNDFCSYSDVFSLIAGKFTSVQVTASAMGGTGIFIRGPKSLLGDTEAIYVVDGSQAANGVVVIETKGYIHQSQSNN